MSNEKPIDLAERRNEKILGDLLEALHEGFSQASNNPLPYHLGLQSASLETTENFAK